MLTPIGGAMLYRAFPVEERARAAIGVLGVAVMAPAIGPMLGGILVDEASWRWIFCINGPIGSHGGPGRSCWLRRRPGTNPAGSTSPDSCSRRPASRSCSTPSTIGPHEGWIVAEDARVRVRRRGLHRRPRRRRAADRATDPRVPPAARPIVPHDQHRLVDDVRRVLRDDLRPAAVPAEPARVQRVRERARPVAPGDRRVPRLEPARPAAVPGDRTAAVDGGRDHTHRHRSRAASPWPGSTRRCRRSPSCRSCRGLPSGLVFVSIQTAAYGTTSVVDTGGRRRCSTRNARSPTPAASPWRRP